MSKITIIEPNTSDKDQIRNYLVKGERGDDGVSPTFETSKTGDTATITITDVEGEHEVELKDGVSPTVETSKSGKVTTVTITDAEGTHTATINDGEDGATTNIINSETLTDKTTQTYSANIVDTFLDDKANSSDVLVKGNIVILTGTLEVAPNTDNHMAYAVTELDYPTGFNKENTVVLSKFIDLNMNGVYAEGSVVGVNYQTPQNIVYASRTPSVFLRNSKININVYSGDNSRTRKYDYRVILMKLDLPSKLIEIGDNLQYKSLHYDFTNLNSSSLVDGRNIVTFDTGVTINEVKIEGGSTAIEVADNEGGSYYIYDFGSTPDLPAIGRYTGISPYNFGNVTSINTSSPAYNYISVYVY